MFERLLEKLATELDARSIAYMIIGGQAVLLYAEPRLTRDIDVTVGMSITKLTVLLDIVRALGLVSRVNDPQDFVRQTMVLPCEEAASGIRVDFILSNSAYETEAMGRVNKVKIGNREVRYASVEDLLIHKLVAGRPRDIDDVRSILLKNARYDRAYVQRWLKDFENMTGAPLLVTLSDLERL
jgi:predicted nucleotidyltransferase